MSETPLALPFDLRALEVFLTVCESGGMALAARRLGITQPAVSQTVAELEARTGALLFDRRVRPLGLTQAGAVLRQRASMLLAEARQIGPLLREVGQGRLPFLRVGMVDSLSRALTGALARFLGQAAVQSAILSGLTAAHAAALVTRQLDLFLGADDLEDLEGLERHLLLEEPYVLLCPTGLPAPTDVEALAAFGADRPLIRFSARSRTGIEIERHLRRLGIDFPRHQEFDTRTASPRRWRPGWAGRSPRRSACVRRAAGGHADVSSAAGTRVEATPGADRPVSGSWAPCQPGWRRCAARCWPGRRALVVDMWRACLHAIYMRNDGPDP